MNLNFVVLQMEQVKPTLFVTFVFRFEVFQNCSSAQLVVQIYVFYEVVVYQNVFVQSTWVETKELANSNRNPQPASVAAML